MAALDSLPEKLRALAEKELLPGETVVWAGKGVQTPRTRILVWGAVLFALAMIALQIAFTIGKKGSFPVMVYFFGPFFTMLAALSPAPAYLVTDRRVLKITGTGASSFVPTAAPKGRLEGARGAGSVLFDKGTGESLMGIPDVVGMIHAIETTLLTSIPGVAPPPLTLSQTQAELAAIAELNEISPLGAALVAQAAAPASVPPAPRVRIDPLEIPTPAPTAPAPPKPAAQPAPDPIDLRWRNSPSAPPEVQTVQVGQPTTPAPNAPAPNNPPAPVPQTPQPETPTEPAKPAAPWWTSQG